MNPAAPPITAQRGTCQKSDTCPLAWCMWHREHVIGYGRGDGEPWARCPVAALLAQQARRDAWRCRAIRPSRSHQGG